METITIENSKTYNVTHFKVVGNDILCFELGRIPGWHLKKITNGFKYDKVLRMFFSETADDSFSVEEI